MSSALQQSRETSDTEAPPAASEARAASPPPPRKRGRKRILPVMTDRERPRYYRQREAAARAENPAVVQALQDQVDSLELQDHLHRQLLDSSLSTSTRGKIVHVLANFLMNQLATLKSTRNKVHHELERVHIAGDASGPIVQLECSLRGRFVPSIVRQIYPHIIGNSILLDRLIHEDMEYACHCWFFFSVDGTLEYRDVEMDGMVTLFQTLGDLRTVGDIIADIGSV